MTKGHQCNVGYMYLQTGMDVGKRTSKLHQSCNIIGSFIVRLARHLGYDLDTNDTQHVPMFVFHHTTLLSIGCIFQEGNGYAFIEHAPHQQ